MPVAAGPAPTRKLLMTMLRGFLLQILPGDWEIVEGQINRVPEPGAGNFVAMIPQGIFRLATTVDTWSASLSPRPTTMEHEQSIGVKVQLQLFGVDSFDGVNTITTLLRSPGGVAFFDGTDVAPLTCDDGQQIPFTDGEHQYEDRWILEASFQMSVAISTTQQFADTVAFELELPVDLEPVT